MQRPLVAVVGRPNVGKSTLFNRLVGRRLAIVEDLPGTTRDRLVADAEWAGKVFDVVDTGGLGLDGGSEIDAQVTNQVDVAIEQADVIIQVVDALEGPTAADAAVAERLRKSGKPVVLAVNKSDSAVRRLEAGEFWSLGLGTPYPISAIHGAGTGDMLDAVAERLPAVEEVDEDPRLAIAVIGRPNVGKSSIVNRLVGHERVVVSAVPGTTRDAIDTVVVYEGEEIVLVDTAGIRRRGKVEPGIEKYSVLRATRALDRADVAVLVIDAVEGATAQDAHIAGLIQEAGVGAILAVNKWDLVEKDERTADEFAKVIRAELKFLDYAPLLFLSALTGQRVTKLLELAQQVHATRQERVTTAELNRLVADIQARHNPPSRHGKRLRIYYATQVAVEPPRFALFVNDTELVHFSYERFVENQIRLRHPFTGTPIRLSFRPRGGRDETASSGRGRPARRSRP
jgi:GTP-binding protein